MIESIIEDKFNSLYNEKEDYKSRCQKAIEYILKHSQQSGTIINGKFIIENIELIYDGNNLLNILRGSDKE